MPRATPSRSRSISSSIPYPQVQSPPMNRARHLLNSSIIVIFFLAIDKLVGLVRTQLVSATFGTSDAYDAFTAANQLPELL
ncbi:MAG: hypothetical protein M5U34_40350 [Chloroflexi bacterium]|nr:hypothetical protein [Chloroflexota bacterium]